MPEPTLTLRQAASALGITTATLHSAIRRGHLAAHKADTARGPVWLVAAGEVERYRREHLGRAGWPKSSAGSTGTEG